MTIQRIAIRCITCGTLYEIPLPEEQNDEIKEQYENIMESIRFPCPECGEYQALDDEIDDDFEVILPEDLKK